MTSSPQKGHPRGCRQRSTGRLQRLDGDLAELDYARAVLQRERPFGEQAVVKLHGLLTVEDHSDLPSLSGDFVGVPFAAGLGHRVHLGEMDDPTGAVGRVRALVENVHLIARPVGDGRGILATQEDAAVGVVACPELDVHLEVLVCGLGDQMRGGLACTFVGDDRAVLNPPVGLTDAVPFTADGLAIEQRDPARTGLTRNLGRSVEGNGCEDESYNKSACAYRYALHRDLLPAGRSMEAFSTVIVRKRASVKLEHPLPSLPRQQMLPEGA